MLPGMEMGVQSGGSPGGTGGGYGAFAVEISPSSASRTITGRTPRLVTTGTVNVTATGGTEPYSYAWSQTDGFVSLTVNTSAGNAASFSATLEPGDFVEATMRVTVTDATLGTSYADLPITLHLVDIGTGEEV